MLCCVPTQLHAKVKEECARVNAHTQTQPGAKTLQPRYDLSKALNNQELRS